MNKKIDSGKFDKIKSGIQSTANKAKDGVTNTAKNNISNVGKNQGSNMQSATNSNAMNGGAQGLQNHDDDEMQKAAQEAGSGKKEQEGIDSATNSAKQLGKKGAEKGKDAIKNKLKPNGKGAAKAGGKAGAGKAAGGIGKAGGKVGGKAGGALSKVALSNPYVLAAIAIIVVIILLVIVINQNQNNASSVAESQSAKNELVSGDNKNEYDAEGKLKKLNINNKIAGMYYTKLANDGYYYSVTTEKNKSELKKYDASKPYCESVKGETEDGEEINSSEAKDCQPIDKEKRETYFLGGYMDYAYGDKLLKNAGAKYDPSTLFSRPVYSTCSTGEAKGEACKLLPLVDSDGKVVAESTKFVKSNKKADKIDSVTGKKEVTGTTKEKDQDGNEVKKETYAKSNEDIYEKTDETTPGVWDYGLAPIVNYEKKKEVTSIKDIKLNQISAYDVDEDGVLKYDKNNKPIIISLNVDEYKRHPFYKQHVKLLDKIMKEYQGDKNNFQTESLYIITSLTTKEGTLTTSLEPKDVNEGEYSKNTTLDINVKDEKHLIIKYNDKKQIEDVKFAEQENDLKAKKTFYMFKLDKMKDMNEAERDKWKSDYKNADKVVQHASFSIKSDKKNKDDEEKTPYIQFYGPKGEKYYFDEYDMSNVYRAEAKKTIDLTFKGTKYKSTWEYGSDGLRVVDEVNNDYLINYLNNYEAYIPSDKIMTGFKKEKDFQSNEKEVKQLEAALKYIDEESVDNNTGTNNNSTSNALEIGKGTKAGTAKKILADVKLFQYIKTYSEMYGVDPHLVVGLFAVESSGNHEAHLTGGAAVGISQIECPPGHVNANCSKPVVTSVKAYNFKSKKDDSFKIDNANTVFDNKTLHVSDLEQNVRAGIMQLASRMSTYYHNIPVSIQAYNYGPGGIQYTLAYYLGGMTEAGADDYYEKSSKIFDYVKSNKNDWINSKAREWYTNGGWKRKFGGGGGNATYLEEVLGAYIGPDKPYVMKKGSSGLSDEKITFDGSKTGSEDIKDAIKGNLYRNIFEKNLENPDFKKYYNVLYPNSDFDANNKFDNKTGKVKYDKTLYVKDAAHVLPHKVEDYINFINANKYNMDASEYAEFNDESQLSILANIVQSSQYATKPDLKLYFGTEQAFRPVSSSTKVAVNGSYGFHLSTKSQLKTFNNGLIFDNKTDDTVHAMADGIVETAGSNVVTILHKISDSENNRSFYYNLKELKVKAGDEVKGNDVLGKSNGNHKAEVKLQNNKHQYLNLNFLDKLTYTGPSDMSGLGGEFNGESVNGHSTAKVPGYIIPVKGGVVTAASWYYPASFGGGWHQGVDLATWHSDPFRPWAAPADGYVLNKKSNDGAAGNWIAVAVQAKGDKDTYGFIGMHNSSLESVSPGAKIKQGQILAHVGSTGNSTGPHSHVEVVRFPNQTPEQVLKKYNGDFYLGIPYGTSNACTESTPCRLKPHEFFGLNIGSTF